MNFDSYAKTWDNEDMVNRSKVIAEKIKNIISCKENATAMEFGCATGLISFNLVDNFKKIVLIDSSSKMIDVLNEKIAYSKNTNMKPILMDLTKESYNSEKFDVIYTSMALHHIKDTKKIITDLYNLLNDDGLLCIVELDKEDGSFHSNDVGFDGHNGFEHSEIIGIFMEVGLVNVGDETFCNINKIMNKNTLSEKTVEYSIFYVLGKKQ